MRRGLGFHVLGLALVLLALLPVVGTDGVISADEGAMLAELEVLERTGDWTLPNSEPVADPQMRALPLELSERSGEGRWAPFAKHPAHIALLRPVYALGGYPAVLVLSLASVVAASTAAALLADRIRAGTGPAALWLTGLGSPLLFDGFQVVGHAVGAALAGSAALVALRAAHGVERRSRAVALVATAVLVALLGLVRSEGVLLGLALGAALVVWGCANRTPRAVVAGVASGLAAGAVRVLEPSLMEAVLGGESLGAVGAGSVSGGGSFLSDRWEGFRTTVLDAGYGVEDGEAFLLVAAVCALAGAGIWRWRRDEKLLRLLAVAAALLAVARLLTTEFLVPGLVPAMPVLAVGLLGLDLRLARDRHAGPLAMTAALFALAVFATQYATGGTGEWGGRYLAIGMPVAVPVAVGGLCQLSAGLSPSGRRTAIAALSVVTATLAAGAVRAAHDARASAREVADAVVATVEGTGVDAVVTDRGAVSRAAWEDVLDRRWLTTPSAEVASLADRLAAEGTTRIAVVTREPDPLVEAMAARWRVAQTTELPGRLTAVAFEAR